MIPCDVIARGTRCRPRVGHVSQRLRPFSAFTARGFVLWLRLASLDGLEEATPVVIASNLWQLLQVDDAGVSGRGVVVPISAGGERVSALTPGL